MPGAEQEGVVELLPDIEKRDAIVKAFQVCGTPAPSLHPRVDRVCVPSMRGSHMVGRISGVAAIILLTRPERDAMGADEYHPISHKGTNLTDGGGIGYTVIDSIDTMLIMGLDEEYQRARTWVQEKLDFDKDAEFNTFEVTGRFYESMIKADRTCPRQLYASLEACSPHTTSPRTSFT